MKVPPLFDKGTETERLSLCESFNIVFAVII
jgi:hypothetical protein